MKLYQSFFTKYIVDYRRINTGVITDMARKYPKDTPENKKERKSYQILLGLFDTDIWDFKGKENHDHGVDYSFEFIENSEYRGYRILAQIKGRSKYSVRGSEIVFDFPVITANYAIGCAEPFVLFLVDLEEYRAYYLPIQDYFIANADKMRALEINKSSVRVFIPLNNTIDDPELKEVAKSQYSFDEEHGLRKVR